MTDRRRPAESVRGMSADDADERVLLARDLEPMQAQILCARLRAAGIDADAGDVNLAQTHSLLSIAIGGACIRVPGAELEPAQQLLAAIRRGDFDLGDDFDPGAVR